VRCDERQELDRLACSAAAAPPSARRPAAINPKAAHPIPAQPSPHTTHPVPSRTRGSRLVFPRAPPDICSKNNPRYSTPHAQAHSQAHAVHTGTRGARYVDLHRQAAERRRGPAGLSTGDAMLGPPRPAAARATAASAAPAAGTSLQKRVGGREYQATPRPWHPSNHAL
jgi:hypothetical protein